VFACLSTWQRLLSRRNKTLFVILRFKNRYRDDQIAEPVAITETKEEAQSLVDSLVPDNSKYYDYIRLRNSEIGERPFFPLTMRENEAWKIAEDAFIKKYGPCPEEIKPNETFEIYEVPLYVEPPLKTGDKAPTKE
jgi:hypothetical protein